MAGVAAATGVAYFSMPTDDSIGAVIAAAREAAAAGRPAIVDVAIEGDTAREVARYEFENRLRAIAQGPDGAIWVAQDGKGAKLLKLTAR